MCLSWIILWGRWWDRCMNWVYSGFLLPRELYGRGRVGPYEDNFIIFLRILNLAYSISTLFVFYHLVSNWTVREQNVPKVRRYDFYRAQTTNSEHQQKHVVEGWWFYLDNWIFDIFGIESSDMLRNRSFRFFL